MKDIHKKWIIALQTSKKQKGKLLERNEKGELCYCCLGVLARTCNLKQITENNTLYFSFSFDTISKSIFLDNREYDLFDQLGCFHKLNLTINDQKEKHITNLASLNDITSLSHKDISKFIYIFRDCIIESEGKEKELIELKFEKLSEFKSFLKESIKKSNFAEDLKKWRKELNLQEKQKE